MRLLLDQGLPRGATSPLRDAGFDAVHVGDIGMATADDVAILQHARETGSVLVTLDADFHALLAVSGAPAPSVIRIRIEGLHSKELAELLIFVTERCQKELEQGAAVSVEEGRVRLRALPLIR